MKKIIIACAVISLAGCAGFSTIRNFGSEPLVNESIKVGATKEHVLKVGGQPKHSQPIVNGNGTCFDYVLQKNDETTPYYVAFNPQGLVINGGFTTCDSADKQGVLKSAQPIRQIY